MTGPPISNSALKGRLTPEAEALLAQLRANGFKDWSRMGLEGARSLIEGLVALTGQAEPVSRVEDIVITSAGRPDIRGRLYVPDALAPLPVLIYMHGGGWAIGNYTLVNSIVRVLANRSGCAILSLNYRRAPENKYPAALEDVYVALKWVLENAALQKLDPHRVGVGGDSSGANLAAAATLLCRDRGGPQLSFQLLVYPVLAHDYGNESYQRFGDGVASALSRDDVAWFQQLYTNAPEELDLPYVSPLLAADLTGLPPALLVLAEIDPLFHEGTVYADRLSAVGIPVERKVFPGMFHGFWWIAGVLEEARSALNEAAAWLRAACSEQSTA